MGKLSAVLLLCAIPLHSFASPAALASSEGRDEEFGSIVHLQNVTDDLRGRMNILERVVVAVVDRNPLVMSVETMGGRSGPFVISADREFVRSLSLEELEATLAHELGHVWIYTHHPYVQTERLANDIALRVTRPDVLVPVYEKVWKRLGTRGNLADYITLPASR